MPELIIRRAVPEDSHQVASLIALAMHDIILRFIGEDSEAKAQQLLYRLVSKKGNQYSFENCWVAEIEKEVVAAACIYDGAKLKVLRKPVAEEIAGMFGRNFNPEDETQAGEFYIDSVGVMPSHQGMGIGTKIFEFLIEEYVYTRKKVIGLLVDKENPDAKRLYLKLGFKYSGDKNLAGKQMEHFQFEI